MPVAIALIVCLVGSIGCGFGGPKSRTGAVLGSASGGLLAAAAGGGVTGILGGALLGGLLGGAVGDMLDQRDKELATQAAQQSLEAGRTGQVTTLKNPDNGHSGSITPTETYQASDGRFCRRFQQTIVVDGKTAETFGTACRQPDGTWESVQ
jgi:surface antigen